MCVSAEGMSTKLRPPSYFWMGFFLLFHFVWGAGESKLCRQHRPEDKRLRREYDFRAARMRHVRPSSPALSATKASCLMRSKPLRCFRQSDVRLDAFAEKTHWPNNWRHVAVTECLKPNKKLHINNKLVCVSSVNTFTIRNVMHVLNLKAFFLCLALMKRRTFGNISHPERVGRNWHPNTFCYSTSSCLPLSMFIERLKVRKNAACVSSFQRPCRRKQTGTTWSTASSSWLSVGASCTMR